MPWRNLSERGKNILIIPPTNAICWYFNENNWEKNILNFLKETLSAEDFKKVKLGLNQMSLSLTQKGYI